MQLELHYFSPRRREQGVERKIGRSVRPNNNTIYTSMNEVVDGTSMHQAVMVLLFCSCGVHSTNEIREGDVEEVRWRKRARESHQPTAAVVWCVANRSLLQCM